MSSSEDLFDGLDVFERVDGEMPIAKLRWMLDGKSAGGVALRGPEETPSRFEALRMYYTGGSAWFAHDDARRGTLAVGKLSDWSAGGLGRMAYSGAQNRGAMLSPRNWAKNPFHGGESWLRA